MCEWRSVRVRCHESPHGEAVSSHLRLFHTVSEKLSEKGYEQGFKGSFGRYEEAEMGQKGASRRSVGLRHGCFEGFSDSFSSSTLAIWPRITSHSLGAL